MTTFVLVHGAWHGGWAWDRVSPRLQEAGANVVAPTLTGLDEESPEASPEIGLQTHVEDVVRALDALSDGPATLVGHSYAGLVVREAADRRPELVGQVILVDGWAGPDGSSLLSLAPDWFTEGIRQAVTDGGDDELIPAPHPAVFGISHPADVAWLEEKLSPQPLATFTDPTRLNGAVDEIPGTAIYCKPPNLPFADFGDELGYQLVPIEGPHDVMVSDPELVAEQLLAVSATDRQSRVVRAVGQS
jgi:pimeloyl-ACP methyl ester carboxylesterase